MSDLHVVLGGSGGLGNATVRALAEHGKKVRAVNRAGDASVPEGVELHAADAADLEELRVACQGASVIYNCVNLPYNRWPELLPPVIDNTLQVAGELGARYVYGDNLYCYGDVDGPIHEGLPRAASGTKGKIRAEMEQRVMDAHEKGTVQVTIGRGSDFYGPWSFGHGENIFVPAVQGKKAKAIGDIDTLHTWSYTLDMGRGLEILGDQDAALGDVWHLPSAEPITTRHLIETAYQEAGNGDSVNIMSAGNLVVTLMGLFNPIMAELKEMMYEWNKPYIVDHSKFEKAFGAHPTPHSQAIHDTVHWFMKWVEREKGGDHSRSFEEL